MAIHNYATPVTPERIRFVGEAQALQSFIQAADKIGKAASDYFWPELTQHVWQDEEGDIHDGPGEVYGYDISGLFKQTRGLQGYDLYLRVHELLAVPSPDDGIRLGVVDFQDAVATLMELENGGGGLSGFLHRAADYYVKLRTPSRLDEPGKQLLQGLITRFSTLDEAISPAFGLDSYMLMLMQMTLARVVENFELYLSELMRRILRSTHTGLSNSNDVTITSEQIRRFKTIDNEIAKQSDKLVRGGAIAIQQNIKKELGFELFPTMAHLEQAETYVQLRHIMVHNRGIVDEKFLGRLPGNAVSQFESQLGKPVQLTVRQVTEAASFLAASVEDIDRRAIAKWALPHHGPGIFQLA